MKRFQEQLKKRAESVNMRAFERRELRERLVAYMEYHPLPQSAMQQSTKSEFVTETYRRVEVKTSLIASFVGSFAVLLLIIVPVAAERAVPGDVLYPVKVNFNEEIRSTLAVSPYAKVEWETKRLERRIAEARLLASEGRLTEDVEAEVTEAVRAHSDAAQQGIAEIRETDSDEAAIAEIAFESALAVQSEVLEGTLKKEVVASGGASTTPGHSVAGLAGAVEATRRTLSENKTVVQPSYEKLAARIELETSRAYELFESVKPIALEAEVRDIERRIGDVERKILEAKQVHDGQELVDEDNASSTDAAAAEVLLLRAALSDIQKLISFMTDIDVRENVTIEELVPITLTLEEREAAVVTLQEEAKQRWDTFSALLETIATDALSQKVASGLTEATARIQDSVAALEAGDIAVAELAIREAHAYLNDIQTLTAGVADTVVPNEGGDASTTPATSTDDAATGTGTVGEVEGIATTSTTSVEREEEEGVTDSVE